MLHQVVEVAEEGRYLAAEHGFLTVQAAGEEVGRVPIDDVSVLILSARGGSVSKPLLARLAERGSVAVICGDTCTPVAMLVPYGTNGDTAGRIRDQIGASIPLTKRLWQTLVQAKLSNQARLLDFAGRTHAASKVRLLRKGVTSGDKENREATAARVYWASLFMDDFVRSNVADARNSFLNYGYAVLRSLCARAVCAAGLLPALGIGHTNRRNSFALADDLMEPYRPVVDAVVVGLRRRGADNLGPEEKQRLTSVVRFDVETNSGRSPLCNVVHRLAVSVTESFAQGKNVLELPDPFPTPISFEELCS